MFECRRTVRFGECDPAGVVYYPTYFHWFHESMEVWFEQGLGHPYAEILTQMGFPAVSVECQFRRPLAVGAEVIVELAVQSLGRSSMTLGLQFFNAQRELCAFGTVKTVCIATSKEGFQFQSMEIPDWLREKILQDTWAE